MKGITLNPCKL